ncbi:hypothetical protein [Kineosporia sp. NBRC 101731]|uniref:hypothetical protein n=1 Tax=Kineosporia sp. NBRC 101731 TaxID=3032199 RepID=UPI0024A16792|nr:hypothetical protein [Kineosporia sp. NBRC 101731]GLY32080.1 hypothetical protein Kisp02_54450 [Kineosporia sp. NBRC 101731]
MRIANKAAALALTAGSVLTAAPAHAETTQHLSLSCTSGGTTVRVAFDYMTNGYTVRYWNAAWTTTPETKLDRIDLSQNPWAGNSSYQTWWAKGGKPSTHDDVKASGSKTGFITSVQAGHDVPDIRVRLRVWGGKGKTTGSCRTSRPLQFTS